MTGVILLGSPSAQNTIKMLKSCKMTYYSEDFILGLNELAKFEKIWVFAMYAIV